ncbi:MAG: hypothetical protein OCC45_10440 [Desulfotalea sp.]
MRNAIGRIVRRMFPELADGYHLDRYARIVKIANPPTGGETCDRMEPMFAADIEIVDVNGNRVTDLPIYEAVPLPLPMGGNEEGFFMYPRPGTIVTVRWIEGNPAHPVIQHVYPMGLKLPAVPDNMARWQQKPGVFQTVNPSGDWNRETDTNITDKAGGNISHDAGQNLVRSAGSNVTEKAGANSSEEVGTSKSIKAGTNILLEAPLITIKAPGGEGANLLQELTGAIEDVKLALQIIADHSHPTTEKPNESGPISEKAGEVGVHNGRVKGLMG